MRDRSFNDKLVAFAVELQRLEEEMEGVSDHGDVTGFCNERTSIKSDAENAIDRLYLRVDSLRYRLNKWKAQQPEGGNANP